MRNMAHNFSMLSAFGHEQSHSPDCTAYGAPYSSGYTKPQCRAQPGGVTINLSCHSVPTTIHVGRSSTGRVGSAVAGRGRGRGRRRGWWPAVAGPGRPPGTGGADIDPVPGCGARLGWHRPAPAGTACHATASTAAGSRSHGPTRHCVTGVQWCRAI